MTAVLKSIPPRAVPVVRPIGENPEFAEARLKLSALETHLLQTEARIAIHELAFWENSTKSSDRDAAARQIKKLRALQKPDAPKKKPALDLAIALILGRREADASPAADIEQARRDVVLLREAIAAQTAIVEEIRGRLSFEAAKALVVEHRARGLAVFRAAQALIEARDAENEIRQALAANGYHERLDLLPVLSIGGAYALGSETWPDSQISTARRDLEGRKIL